MVDTPGVEIIHHLALIVLPFSYTRKDYTEGGHASGDDDVMIAGIP